MTPDTIFAEAIAIDTADGTTDDPAHKSPGRSEKQQTRRPGAAGTALRRVGQAEEAAKWRQELEART